MEARLPSLPPAAGRRRRRGAAGPRSSGPRREPGSGRASSWTGGPRRGRATPAAGPLALTPPSFSSSQVSWAHPKFGGMLASCSFDHRVIIWRETDGGGWAESYRTPAELHDASINSVAFAPHELGALLAGASSDGSLSILAYNQASGGWDAAKIDRAHATGALAVSWAPAVPSGAMVSKEGASKAVKRIVSCGCDNTAKVWEQEATSGEWKQVGADLAGHSGWVRDVAWAPNLGMPYSTIATASEDGSVLIWTQKGGGEWTSVVLNQFGAPVWRVSWSVSGGILAVTDGNNQVTLWKEQMDSKWVKIS